MDKRTWYTVFEFVGGKNRFEVQQNCASMWDAEWAKKELQKQNPNGQYVIVKRELSRRFYN